MPDSILERIPVVGGLGYVERVRRLSGTFTATLQPEPGNRYFRHALAVMVNGDKVGYVAPEIGASYYDAVRESAAAITCPGRRALHSDHESSGVELLLDFRNLAVNPVS